MLSQNEILNRILSGKIQFVRKMVRVQYEPRIQLPIDFWYLEKHHEILEVINEEKPNRFCSQYLVRTDKGVYNLKYFFVDFNFAKVQIGLWIIEYKVIE